MAAKSQLDKIMLHKREELAKRKRLLPESDLRATLFLAPPPRDLAAALRQPGLSWIGTLQRATPSKGLLRNGYDAATFARELEKGGARAVAVQSDAKFYQGKIEDVTAARQAVSIPVIRTDFLFDPYQLVESRAAGADAVLLLAALLPGNRLGEMRAQAEQLGLQALVEVHDEAEVTQALAAGATLLSLTERSPYTFDAEGDAVARLRSLIPSSVLVVVDGVVHDQAAVRALRESRVDGAFLGERLLKARDVTAAVRDVVRGG